MIAAEHSHCREPSAVMSTLHQDALGSSHESVENAAKRRSSDNPRSPGPCLFWGNITSLSGRNRARQSVTAFALCAAGPPDILPGTAPATIPVQ